MKKIDYFEHPVQIEFLDFDGSDKDHLEWKGGIGHEDAIICGCCGGLISCTELWDEWEDWASAEFPEVETPIRVFTDWVDISESIRG